MALPVLTPAAERMYAQVAHLDIDGETEGWPWAVICAVLAAPIDPLYEILAVEMRPWTAVWDPDTAPAWVLPWTAQFVGVEFPPGATEDQMRTLLREKPSWRRGSPAAIRAIPKPYLTGDRRVTLYERVAGNPYALAVVTYTDETPDPAAVERALRDPKHGIPAGRNLTYTVVPGWIIAEMIDAYVGQTIADLIADFATVDDLVSRLPI